jgi:hypothetical protein
LGQRLGKEKIYEIARPAAHQDEIGISGYLDDPPQDIPSPNDDERRRKRVLLYHFPNLTNPLVPFRLGKTSFKDERHFQLRMAIICEGRGDFHREPSVNICPEWNQNRADAPRLYGAMQNGNLRRRFLNHRVNER